jgi:ADP-heptose:LPS heptosyltransferase
MHLGPSHVVEGVDDAIYLVIDGGLGDCLLATPAIESLKRNNPHKALNVAHIGSIYADILRGNPFIDRLEHYDGFEALSKSIAWLRPTYSLLLPSITRKDLASKIICDCLQTPFYGDRLAIYLTEEEVEFGRRELERLRESNNLSGIKGWVGICTTNNSSLNRDWGSSNWEALVSYFKDFGFIHLGCKSLHSVSGAIDVSYLGLRQQISVLNSCKGFVGLDSFFAHCTSALGVRGVVLFGDSTPTVWGHYNNINIYKALGCSPCIDVLPFNHCPYGTPCVKAIGSDEVISALKSLI